MVKAKAYNNPVDKTVLLEQHTVLVKRIAYHLLARLPASVIVDDLIQSGMIGLFEAANNFDSTKGASFETYAGIRIRGSIVDEMRRGDWAPRSVHRNSRRVADAIAKVESRTGRDAKDQDVADEMGLNLDEYFAILSDASSSRLFSFEEDFGEEGSRAENAPVSMAFVGPFDGLQRESLKQSLAQAIKQLPEREKLVLALYYDEELNLKEIGEIIGVSESRVSQIHSQSALRLRARLQDWQGKD